MNSNFCKDKDDNIYYSINVTNIKNEPIPASYEENRTIPLLLNQSKYKLEILKFSIPTNTLPMFNYNNDKFIILNCNNKDYPYNPSNPSELYPIKLTNANILTGEPQSIENPFLNNSIYYTLYGINQYSIYYYQQFLLAINYTLQLAYNQLIIDNPTITSGAPYFIYNNDTKLFSLIANKEYDPLNINYNGITIYTSEDIGLLFHTIPIYYNSTLSTNKLIQFLVYSIKNNDYTLTEYIMTQQSSSISYWYFFRNIYLVSNNISVASLNLSQINNKSIAYNIIASYTYIFENSLNYDTSLRYLQIGTKDQIDLLSNLPLYKIDFSLIIQDKYGKLYDIVLSKNSSFELLVKFHKI